MKNKLIVLLKTLFASKGFNAKELESLADLVIGQNNLTEDSTEQDLQTASEAAKPTADFVQSVASRQVSDVKKPKTVEPVTKPEEVKPEDDPNETPTEKLLKQALAGITALTAEVATIKGEKVTNTRREQYAKALEGTSDVFKAKALKDFDRMQFKDDSDFESYLADATEDAKGFIQDDANSGLGGDRPAGGVGGGDATKGKPTEAQVDALADSIL